MVLSFLYVSTKDQIQVVQLCRSVFTHWAFLQVPLLLFNEAKWIQFILCIISFLWLHKNNVGNEDYQNVSVFWDGQWLETLRYTARVLFTWIFVIVIFKFLSLLYNGGNNICVLYIFKIYHVHCNEHFALLNQSLSYMLTH